MDCSNSRLLQVLDPASLGFRPTSDPNRVNAGEIDSVPPVLGGKRWTAESFYTMMICDDVELFWGTFGDIYKKGNFLRKFSCKKPKNLKNREKNLQKGNFFE